MIHYADNPSCSALRNDKAPHFMAAVLGIFRYWQRACPNLYCAECSENARDDSDRYAELRKLVEAWQAARAAVRNSEQGHEAAFFESLDALGKWRHR